jgi:hypothetical protein
MGVSEVAGDVVKQHRGWLTVRAEISIPLYKK